jgi:threonine synthase
MITPQTEHLELAKKIGLKDLYFKREDLHPYGSHKGRSIPVMIDAKIAEGSNEFSGNAALAAVRYIQKLNAKDHSYFLTIFVGKKINPEKKKKLVSEIYDDHITVFEADRPLQAIFKMIATGRKLRANLRQSTDPVAVVGYKELAIEISATPELSDVFLGTSSGTAAQGLAGYFTEHKKQVAVHIVQPISNSVIAREFDAEEREGEITIADAIIDKVAHRKDALVDTLKKTNGAGWIVSNDEIKEAQRLLRNEANIEASPNGALGFAGLLRAVKKGTKFRGSVVCIITGQ